MKRKLRFIMFVALAVAAAALAAGCGGDDGDSGSGAGTDTAASSEPIKIGASLPLTGDFAEPGVAAKQGYKIWQAAGEQERRTAR